LQDAGFSVVVFDNLSRGFSDAVGNARLVVGDLRSPVDLENCFATYEFDLVMHFAALAYVSESVISPELYYQNNVIGTFNLLAAMIKYGVYRMVFSSSCAVYGEPENIPISEKQQQQPINPYGKTKLVIEQALVDYAMAYEMKSISLRYFNAAGCDPQGRASERHDPETHLIPLVLAEALRIKCNGNPKKTTLQIFGTDFLTRDGSCVRDYVHVSDICNAHLLAVERLLTDENQGAEVYNLANGDGFSVFEVISMCREITGVPIEYSIMPRRAGDPAVLVGDACKIKKNLGWIPKYSDLQRIIQTAWKWHNGKN